MNFAFSEEQEMLRAAAARFLEAECPSAFVREMIEHETAHSAELWKKLAGLGWLGLGIPQELGGMGGGFLDLAAILEETGKALLPGPFFTTSALGVPAITLAASKTQRRRILPALAAGSSIVTLAHLEASGRSDASGVMMRAKRRGEDFVLTGEKRFVPDAHVADGMVVAARTAAPGRDPERGITLFFVESTTPGIARTSLRTIDMTRRLSHVSFDAVRVPGSCVLGRVDQGWPALRRTLEIAAAAIAVESVGVAQRALDLSVAYARERTQFGKPIGSFQAVKHKCVDMLIAVENARSLSYYAAWAVDERHHEAARAVAMAKAYASDMGKNVTGDAIQVHGGVGCTWEHDVHLYYRRALANEGAFGTAPLHREAVARELSL